MIVSKNLTYQYTDKIRFNFPDIVCNSGEVLLITGGSGKGKTTLLHLLAGLLKPKKGEISIGNNSFSELSEIKTDQFRGENIGLVLQQNHFIASLSVLENILIGSWLSNKKGTKEFALQLLEYLDIKDQAHKSTSQLSVGQQQRVSIARALINNPKVLLADEPTSSLDDENTTIVANLLSKLSKEYNTSLIIVTHDQRLKDIFKNIIEL